MKILDFLLCDDIRVEVKNKITIVGTYNDQLVFETLSGKEVSEVRSVRAAAYIKLLLYKEEGASSFRISLKDKLSDKVYFDQTFQVDPNHPYGAPFPILLHPLTLNLLPGEVVQLKVETEVDKGSKEVEVSVSEYKVLERKLPA